MTKSDKSLEVLEKPQKIKYKEIIDIIIYISGIIIIFNQIFNIIKNYKLNEYNEIINNCITCFLLIYLYVWSIILKIKKHNNIKYTKIIEEKYKNMLEITDNIRCFKHDFNNIMQAITGYIDVKDMDSLRKYFDGIAKECHHMNVLEVLNCQVTENPAIYSVLVNKYRKAKEMNITMNVEFLTNLKIFEEKSYVISRMLGILLDNALEATSECNEKTINVSFINEKNRKRNLIIVENTYVNKNIDLNKIFEKDYTTKESKRNSGLGLWKINDILKKDNSLELFTTKNDEMFRQQLEIYC